MIVNQAALERSEAVRSLSGRALALTVAIVGFGGAAFLLALILIHGQLVNWGRVQSVLFVALFSLVGVMGVRLFRLKPRYAGEVLVDDNGVRFRGGTLGDWGLNWRDPTFRITFIVRGEGEGDRGKGTLPTVALAKPGTSLLTPEAYRAIVSKASELGLRVETLSRSNRGWGRTVIRRF